MLSATASVSRGTRSNSSFNSAAGSIGPQRVQAWAKEKPALRHSSTAPCHVKAANEAGTALAAAAPIPRLHPGTGLGISASATGQYESQKEYKLKRVEAKGVKPDWRVKRMKLSKDMRVRFKEAKATQTAARLLELRGSPMSYLKLIKLLYIIDREALLRWGRPVTGDRYVSMDHGPGLSQTLNLITEEPRPDERTIWTQHISQPDKYEVHLEKSAGADELSEAELQLIEEIFARYGSMSRWDLVDLVHKFPEWPDPQGSAIPIQYRDILRAGGKTEGQIEAIIQELDELALADALLPPR